MASGTMAWYGNGLLRMMKGEIDTDTHTFKFALAATAYTPNPDTHDDWADVSANEVTGTGWAAGGQTVTVTTSIDAATNRVRLFCTDINLTGVTLTDGKHGILYSDTHASKALIGYVTFDTALAPSAGPLDIDFDGTNGVLRITY